MRTATIREKLHQYIDSIADEKVRAIYILFENEMDMDAQRRKLIQAEREKYYSGQGQSYSWEEVKQMALNKDKRNGV
jgi:hypothetical protein